VVHLRSSGNFLSLARRTGAPGLRKQTKHKSKGKTILKKEKEKQKREQQQQQQQ